MRAIAYSCSRRYARRRSKRLGRFRSNVTIARYAVLVIGALFILNLIYQVIRKPAELLAPISSSFAKTPESTWRSYAPFFEKYSTKILSPELLGALAQVEGSGNPTARTYWRWQWSWQPWKIYRPASSALGMYQITDGTFIEARKYCIRDHQVLNEGSWFDPESCWFNGFYNRLLPSHSIEMTAAYLHQGVVRSLGSHLAKVSLSQQQDLAAVIHLCGFKAGETFVQRKFRLKAGERCGSHTLQKYLDQVNLMKIRFHRLRQNTVQESQGQLLSGPGMKAAL